MTISLMELFWVTLNALIRLGLIGLVVYGVISLVRLNRRLSRVEALLLELQKKESQKESRPAQEE